VRFSVPSLITQQVCKSLRRVWVTSRKGAGRGGERKNSSEIEYWKKFGLWPRIFGGGGKICLANNLGGGRSINAWLWRKKTGNNCAKKLKGGRSWRVGESLTKTDRKERERERGKRHY